MKEKKYNPSWNHWSHFRTNHCVGVQRIKIVDSSELTTAKFLIYLFFLVHLLLYCRYMDLKKGILLKKIRNYSPPFKLQQVIKMCLNDTLQHLLINIADIKNVRQAVGNSKFFKIWSKKL